MVKVLITIICFLPMLLNAQGFGSFTFDQPFLAKNATATTELGQALLYFWSMDDRLGTDPNQYYQEQITLNSELDAHCSNGYSTNGLLSNAAAFLGGANVTPNPTDTAIFNFTNQSWTVTLWLRQDVSQEQYATVIGGPWHSTDINKCKWGLWSLPAEATLKVSFIESDDSMDSLVLAATSAIQNRWAFVSFGWDSSVSKGFAQIDAQARQLTPAENGGLQNTGTDTLLRWGDMSGAQQNTRWGGIIDEIGVWKRVLTTNEVTTLFNNTNGLPLSSFYP